MTPKVGVGIAAIALSLLAVFPTFELVRTATEVGSGGGQVAAAMMQPVWTTLWVATVTALLSTTGGLAAAWLTERARIPGRGALRLAILAPLLIPPFVSALSWGRAYGVGALGDQTVGVHLPGLYGPIGVIAVLVTNAIPLAYLVVAAGLRTRARPDGDLAARSAGAPSLTVLRTVTLPPLRPSLVAAFALTFITGANAFGVPAVLGRPAGLSTMTTRIYTELAFAGDDAAFAQAVLFAVMLIVLTLSAVTVADLVGDRGARVIPVGVAGGVLLPPGRSAVALAMGAWLWFAFTTAVPAFALTVTALLPAAGVDPTLSNFTFENLQAAVTGTGLIALRTSLGLAGAAALITLVLGGILAGVRHHRAGRTLGAGATLAFAVPGSALAVAVLLAYGSWWRDTLGLILIAYVAKFWALAHRPLAGAVDGLPSEHRLAARAAGATPAAALRTVVLPALLPAIVAGLLLVFSFGFHELTMSSILVGPGVRTLAVAVLDVQRLGDPTLTAALAMVLVGVVALLLSPLLLVRSVRWTR